MRLATQPSGLTDRPSGFDVRPSAGLVCVRLEWRVVRVQMDASWHDGRRGLSGGGGPVAAAVVARKEQPIAPRSNCFGIGDWPTERRTFNEYRISC